MDVDTIKIWRVTEVPKPKDLEYLTNCGVKFKTIMYGDGVYGSHYDITTLSERDESMVTLYFAERAVLMNIIKVNNAWFSFYDKGFN